MRLGAIGLPVLALLAVAPSLSFAQSRIQFGEIDESSLRGNRLLVGAATADGDTDAFFDFGLRMRSSTRGDSLTADTQVRADDRAGVFGRHRLRGVVSTNEMERGDFGADLEVDGRISHGGADVEARQFADIELWPAPYVDASVAVTAWGQRRMRYGKGRLTWPMGYRYRRVDYDDRYAPIGGLETHEVSLGVGMKFEETSVDGWVQMLGFSFAQTTFDPGRSTDAPPPINELQVHVLDVDGIVIHTDEFAISVSVGFGAGGFFSESGSDGTAIFHYGASARYGDAAFGIEMGMRPALQPSGRAGGESMRLDFLLETPAYKSVRASTRFGFACVASLSSSQLCESSTSSMSTTAFQNELVSDVGSGLEAGAYHVSRLAPAAVELEPAMRDNAWPGAASWSHELGLFLRFSR